MLARGARGVCRCHAAQGAVAGQYRGQLLQGIEALVTGVDIAQAAARHIVVQNIVPGQLSAGAVGQWLADVDVGDKPGRPVERLHGGVQKIWRILHHARGNEGGQRHDAVRGLPALDAVRGAVVAVDGDAARFFGNA
ncbi:hypothetical protein D3C71_1657090 [compost metagenome]